MTARPTGTVYGLGVGPGDPELLTLKALRILRAAAIVAYPAPLDGDSFARSIVAQFLTGGQREIAIRVPMVPERFPAQDVYDRAAREIGDQAAAGLDVAILCQGDPFFYGSFMYLFARLATRFPVEIVPGVSSLTACAAAARHPLAARDETLTVIPATLGEAELERRLAGVEAAAIIKLGRHFTKVRDVLLRLGLAKRAHYVERASLPNEHILPLAEIDAAAVPYFAMILLRGAEHEGGP
ncbi:MAG TPA: precorrin-2 C(20)-methyltransferase [Stellaceae bacterium]|jgi:precorrin-2/cobalt-factor-2 C20-methyltransferase|nr:precorrin-2 C(20)-methyltransferase [Stellaceae bacterium]